MAITSGRAVVLLFPTVVYKTCRQVSTTCRVRVVDKKSAVQLQPKVTSLRSFHGVLGHAQPQCDSPVSAVNFVNGVRRMSGAGCNGLLFRQLLDYKSYTYTYLLVDTQAKEAVIIDPVFEMVERDCSLVRELGLNLRYAVNTHVHADHITGTGEIKKRIRTCKSVIAEVSKAKADVHINEGDTVNFGQFKLECYSTPGHTDGCMSYVLRPASMVFTGDAVLIRGCGRTDFQQGNAGKLYDSVHSKIFSLPRNFAIYPGHDYTGQTSSTVGEELQHNSRLTRTKEEFIRIMQGLHLPYPKQIEKAVPANMVCGVFDDPKS